MNQERNLYLSVTELYENHHLLSLFRRSSAVLTDNKNDLIKEPSHTQVLKCKSIQDYVHAQLVRC